MAMDSNARDSTRHRAKDSRATFRAEVVRILRKGRNEEADVLHRRFLADLTPEERAEYLAALDRDES